ncbi:MAG: 3-deoxy-manno-octulosonate cytidylyltransferase [Cyclobacteriaceae bacterium]|jgi:3-deoxy-manno-octulosonate cytidylyltransferase (CMP-KDO synthetase)|nr:3-deoxy-manno-octulosonate cytidylyltransferase [Flammeovirgaceae bacterium]
MGAKIIGIIPARYASTRFPGKPLADLGGQSMIERVYKQVKKAKSLHKVVVATEHELIYDHVKSFGGDVCMTSENHPSGTDRCYEALLLENEKYDYAINIQGDEPFIQSDQIDLLASYLDGQTELATLIKKIDTYEQLNSASEVKVTFNTQNEALYFSRAIIPFIQKIDSSQWLSHYEFYKHVGMYAYRTDILRAITKLELSALEKVESLEQLRWLENGFKIKVAKTTVETMCVDTPEELEMAKKILAGM